MAAVCATGALAAVLSAYRLSLDPPGLHPRAIAFAVAKAEVLVDTPVSQLGDRRQDGNMQRPPILAVTYSLFLKSDAVRVAAASAAGIRGQEISESGPFTLLLGRTNFPRAGPTVPNPAPINKNYRLLVDVDGVRPMLKLYAQAPTTKAAFAIVDRTRQLLAQYVAEQQVRFPLQADNRAVIRTLGPTTGGVVDPGGRIELMTFVFCLVLVLGGAVVFALERRRSRTNVGSTTLSPDATSDKLTEGDDWPHTKRPLPWTVALFVLMIFLVPIDAVSLPIHLPLDSTPDRVLLIAIGMLWLSTLAVVRGKGRPRLKVTRVHFALFVFFGLCCAAAALNSHELAANQEVVPVLKKLVLLASFVGFFVLAASIIRPREVPRFISLMIVLGVIVAVAVIIEDKTRYNVFYALWQKVLPVRLPAQLDQLDTIGRLGVDGPTSEPLELAALLAMVLPFAIIGAIEAYNRRRRLLHVLAATILLAGAVSTARKTSIVAPALGIAVLIAYRPRILRSLLVASVPLLLAIHFVAPGQIGSVFSQLLPGHANTVLTTTDRLARYDAVRPDVMSHLLLGRGFQSYDPHKYRILDNEYLGLLIGVGLIGLVVYLTVFVGLLSLAHPTIRGPDPRRAAAALSSQAAIVVALVANVLFDVLSFPHVSYLFFFVAAMIVALREPSPVLRLGRTPARPSALYRSEPMRGAWDGDAEAPSRIPATAGAGVGAGPAHSHERIESRGATC